MKKIIFLTLFSVMFAGSAQAGLFIHAPMDGDPDDITAPANAWTATPSGTPQFVASPMGGAIDIDGTSAKPGLQYDVNLDTGELAISLWIANENYSQYEELFNINPQSSPYVQLWVTGAGGFEIDFDGTCFSSPSGQLNGSSDYKHIVLTYNQTDVKVYVNGVEIASGARTDPFITDGYFEIGGPGWHVGSFSTKPVTGYFDELKLYNFGVNATQVEYLYTGQACTAPPALDMDGDCIVSLGELEAIAGAWLEDGFSTDFPELEPPL